MKRTLMIVLPALAGWIIGSVIWLGLLILKVQPIHNIDYGPDGWWANGIVGACIVIGLAYGLQLSRKAQ